MADGRLPHVAEEGKRGLTDEIRETAATQNKRRSWRRRKNGPAKRPTGWGEQKNKRTIRDFLPDFIRLSNEPSRFEPQTPCWIWTGALNDGGYGVLNRDGGSWLAHRFPISSSMVATSPASAASATPAITPRALTQSIYSPGRIPRTSLTALNGRRLSRKRKWR